MIVVVDGIDVDVLVSAALGSQIDFMPLHCNPIVVSTKHCCPAAAWAIEVEKDRTPELSHK